MTAYGFDLDGTLDKPAIRQLAADLYEAGHEVVVLAGSVMAEGEQTREGRERKLRRLGVQFTELVHCVHPDIAERGRLKGEACEFLGVALVVDDKREMLDGIATASPVERLHAIDAAER